MGGGAAGAATRFTFIVEKSSNYKYFHSKMA